jgi:hypothetical protein
MPVRQWTDQNYQFWNNGQKLAYVYYGEEPGCALSWNALARNNRATRSIAAAHRRRKYRFIWLGDEVEARRLRQERAHHYLRWTFIAAIGAVIAILIAEGLALLH